MSWLDEYPLPADVPAGDVDPRELERAKALAMMRMGIGMAGREPIGSAMSGAYRTYAGMEQQARQMMLAKLQAYKERMAIQEEVKRRGRTGRLEDVLNKQPFNPGVREGILASKDVPAAWLARKESQPVELTNEGMYPIKDEQGNTIGWTPGIGTVDAQAERSGAIAKAQEGAKARYQFIEVDVGKGQKIQVRADHLSLLNSTGLPEEDKLAIIRSVPSHEMLGAIKTRMAARGLIAQPAVGGVMGDGSPTAPRPAAEPLSPWTQQPGVAPPGVPSQGGFGISADPNYMEREKQEAAGYLKRIETDFPVATQLARTAIPLNHQALDMLNSGQVITGKGGDWATEVGGWLKQIGWADSNNLIANTQTFMINQAHETLAILGSRALGSGTGISKSDQEFAQKLAGGQGNYDEDALRRITRINNQAHREFVAQHNDQVDRYAKAFPNSRVRDLYYIPPPPEYKPRKSETPTRTGASAQPAVVSAEELHREALKLQELERKLEAERKRRAAAGGGG